LVQHFASAARAAKVSDGQRFGLVLGVIVHEQITQHLRILSTITLPVNVGEELRGAV
jgi:hypothetical protein